MYSFRSLQDGAGWGKMEWGWQNRVGLWGVVEWGGGGGAELNRVGKKRVGRRGGTKWNVVGRRGWAGGVGPNGMWWVEEGGAEWNGVLFEEVGPAGWGRMAQGGGGGGGGFLTASRPSFAQVVHRVFLPLLVSSSPPPPWPCPRCTSCPPPSSASPPCPSSQAANHKAAPRTLTPPLPA